MQGPKAASKAALSLKLAWDWFNNREQVVGSTFHILGMESLHLLCMESFVLDMESFVLDTESFVLDMESFVLDMESFVLDMESFVMTCCL